MYVGQMCMWLANEYEALSLSCAAGPVAAVRARHVSRVSVLITGRSLQDGLFTYWLS